MSRQSKDDRLYKELLHDWLWWNRREALLLGASAFSYFLGIFDRAYADNAEFQIQVLPPNNSKSTAGSDEASQNNSASTVRSSDEIADRPAEDRTETEDQLGIAFRAPMCGLQNLTTSQFRATGTPERIPDNLSVAPGSFFSDNASRRFLSGGETAIASAWRSTPTTKANLEGSMHAADRPNDVSPSRVNQALSITAANVAKFVASVDWSELGSDTVEKAIDIAKGKAVEKVAMHLTGLAEGPVVTVITVAIDILKPTPTSESEWTYEDRLSPSERREFFREVWRESLVPKEMPPDGPTLRNAY